MSSAPNPSLGTLQPTLESPIRGAAAVTPHDTNPLATPARALWIGTGDNVRVTHLDGTTAVYSNVPSGFLLPVSATHVVSTSTTATNILALY